MAKNFIYFSAVSSFVFLLLWQEKMLAFTWGECEQLGHDVDTRKLSQCSLHNQTDQLSPTREGNARGKLLQR